MTDKTVKNLEVLTAQIVKNAAYLGISDSTLKDMVTTALNSNPGLEIEMQYTAGSEDKKHCKHYHLMPHHPIPNSIEYSRTQSRFDPICALFGILKRENTGKQYVKNYTNINANRFVKYFMNYLGHLRDRGENRRYWIEGFKLLKSRAFQLMAFNYVCSGWERNLSITEVNKILEEVTNLAKELKTEIKIRRVYIPKPNGKVRPLGVPSKPWRVFLHMLNVLIVWHRTGTDRNQHAYFPGKGVHTAWIKLLERIEEENIYEFDLTSFFPSVNLEANEQILSEELGFPKEIAGYLRRINQTITVLTKEDEIEEDNDRKVLLTTEGKPNPNFPKKNQDNLNKILERLKERDLTWLLSSNLLQRSLPTGWSVYKEIGVPQGAATSCGLATVNLHYLWRELGDTLLMYADDGLVFPKKAERPSLRDDPRGINENEEKSGWIKRNGNWEKTLKFLGLEYIPPTNSEDVGRLRAKTRNGSTVEFTLDRQFLIHLLNEKDLAMWLCEEKQGIQEKIRDAEVIRIRERNPSTLLGYGAQKLKGSQPVYSQELQRSAATEIRNELTNSTRVDEWMSLAKERFKKVQNPLRLLFEGRGLFMLAKMYSGGEANPGSSKLECRKDSWAYTRWGLKLYETLDEYRSMTTIKEELLNELERVWNTFFKIRGHQKVQQFNLDPIYEEVKKDIKSYLKSIKVDMTNISTLACEDLLISGFVLERGEVQFCQVNRIPPIKEIVIEEAQRIATAKRKLRRDEKEFKMMYNIWPRKLRLGGNNTNLS